MIEDSASAEMPAALQGPFDSAAKAVRAIRRNGAANATYRIIRVLKTVTVEKKSVEKTTLVEA